MEKQERKLIAFSVSVQTIERLPEALLEGTPH
jgi:hypothetical protein